MPVRVGGMNPNELMNTSSLVSLVYFSTINWRDIKVSFSESHTEIKNNEVMIHWFCFNSVNTHHSDTIAVSRFSTLNVTQLWVMLRKWVAKCYESKYSCFSFDYIRIGKAIQMRRCWKEFNPKHNVVNW